MALIVKKEEKIKALLEILGDKCTEDSFIEKYKEMYPNDWEKIMAKYRKEERETKPGKTHPMPHPDTYMKNMYKVAMSKKEAVNK